MQTLREISVHFWIKARKFAYNIGTSMYAEYKNSGKQVVTPLFPAKNDLEKGQNYKRGILQ